MTRLDFSSKNAAIVVLLGMWLLFFATAITFSLRPETKELAADIWKLFAGANIGLVALLNSDAKRNDAPPPGATGNPTQQ